MDFVIILYNWISINIRRNLKIFYIKPCEIKTCANINEVAIFGGL